MSLFLALVMLVGVALPSVAMAKGEDEQGTEKVYVHKMLMSKENLGNTKFPGQKGLDETEYNGNQIQNLGAYFGAGSEEIPGVYFVVEKEFDVPDTSEGAAQGATKKEWKAVTATGTEAKADLSDALAGLTKAIKGKNFTALELDTSQLPKGTYRINEVHDKSTYVGKEGKTLSDMKAVPTTITLPLVNTEGVVKEAHVYPKNTEDKPTTNKDFSDQFTETQNGRDNGTDEKTVQNNPETSDKEKKANWKPKNVGDKVEYKVRTTIPAKAKYATAYWNDEMTDGLDLDINSVTLAYTGNAVVTLEKGTDYTITPTSSGKGFELEFKDPGLEKINNKEKEGVITITYSAKLNEKAVVAIPESNDVNFYYGNNPRKGNTPKPNYPDDSGKLKVTKTWADGEWAKNEKATFRIVDAQTGKTVTKDDLVGAPDSYDFKAEKEIGYGTAAQSAEWEYLNKNKQYKIVEISVTDTNGKTVTGWEANYVVNGKGETKVTNYKTNNPEPLNPTEPKVVTYGAKFVKTDTEGKRLQGAEFVVKNSEGKFLTGTAADRSSYETAQAAFVTAVKAYNEAIKDGKAISSDNKVTIGGVVYEDDANAKAAIKALEKARDDAWNATLKDMNGFTATKKDDTGVLKLTSNELGQFEIAGLAPGTYTLVEVKAPDNYVDATKATLEFSFTIKNDGTQEPKNFDFGVTDKDTTNDNAQQIINKKVDIPQTGGIGTVIFTVVGISLMAGAFIAMRKRTAEEN